MIKIIKYLTQSIIVYFFFILGRILGLKVSRLFFSKFFQFLGPKFKSKKIINENLNIYNQNLTILEKKEIISQMWSNSGSPFFNLVFANVFFSQKVHERI